MAEIPDKPELDALIDQARTLEMTTAQVEAQLHSFAYGNCAIDNPCVTREMVDEIADAKPCWCCKGSGKAFNAIDMEWSECLCCSGSEALPCQPPAMDLSLLLPFKDGGTDRGSLLGVAEGVMQARR